METWNASLATLEDDRPPQPADDDIDVGRLVWDVEYRRGIVERLRRERVANDNPVDPGERKLGR